MEKTETITVGKDLVEKEHIYTVGRNVTQSSLQIFRTLEMDLPYDPAVHLGILPKETQTPIQRNVGTPKVDGSTVHNSTNLEATQMYKGR